MIEIWFTYVFFFSRNPFYKKLVLSFVVLWGCIEPSNSEKKKTHTGWCKWFFFQIYFSHEVLNLKVKQVFIILVTGSKISFFSIMLKLSNNVIYVYSELVLKKCNAGTFWVVKYFPFVQILVVIGQKLYIFVSMKF